MEIAANTLTVVLVCGSRDWTDTQLVGRHLDRIATAATAMLVIEGGARGADRAAAVWASRHHVAHEQYRADWGRYATRAGPARNQQMLDRLLDLRAQGARVMVLAFKDLFGRTRGGTEHMVRIAAAVEVHGIIIRHPCDADD